MLGMLLVGLVLLAIGLPIFLYRKRMKEEGDRKVAHIGSPILIGIGSLLIVLSLILGSMVQIPAGHRGVVLQFGGVTGTVLDEGLQWKVPFIQSVKKMEVRTQKYETSATSASEDLQIVSTTVALNYHLEPEEADEVYKTLGREYISRIADPAIHETVKQITATFIAEDLILKRATVKAQIEDSLRDRLSARGVRVEAVSITDFQFSDTFTAAIEAKVAAEQAVLEAENKLLRVRVEAEQREAEAKGEAQARIEQALGEAQFIETVTAAQVAANNAIRESLTPSVLQYIFLDRLGEDIQVLVVPSDDMGLVLPQVLP